MNKQTKTSFVFLLEKKWGLFLLFYSHCVPHSSTFFVLERMKKYSKLKCRGWWVEGGGKILCFTNIYFIQTK